jgi:hypothetical protein
MSKITTVRWTGGVTQMVAHLLCNCKAWLQNPVLQKKKREQGNRGTPELYKQENDIPDLLHQESGPG